MRLEFIKNVVNSLKLLYSLNFIDIHREEANIHQEIDILLQEVDLEDIRLGIQMIGTGTLVKWIDSLLQVRGGTVRETTIINFYNYHNVCHDNLSVYLCDH